MIEEEWRPIPDWNGFYEVSNLGRVRSVARTVETRAGWAMKLPGKVLAARPAGKGYLSVSLSRGSNLSYRYIHTLVLEAFVGPRPEGMEALHGPNGMVDNRASELRWGTSSENNADIIAHGNHPGANKVRCKWGHDLREPNLQRRKLRDGIRGCLACSRAGNHLSRKTNPARFQQLADQYYSQIMTTTTTKAAA